MTSSISVVINTLNEERNLPKALESVKWADEVLVCDMYSADRSVSIAKKMGARVVLHKRLDFVEPARNFAISKASGDWILILDADEQIPASLKERLIQIASDTRQIDYVQIPRKNIIFGKWMKASMWWPDYNIRFFKKGKVEWGDKIHRPPHTLGLGIDLPSEEDFAILHNNYQSIGQYVERMNRYTEIEATQLHKDGYKFRWQDLLEKPLNEFLSRFFANNGYKDGLHGLSLSLLQAFSFLITYLKVWEKEKFAETNINVEQIKEVSKQSGKQIDYWVKFVTLPSNVIKRLIQKAKNKF